MKHYSLVLTLLLLAAVRALLPKRNSFIPIRATAGIIPLPPSPCARQVAAHCSGTAT